MQAKDVICKVSNKEDKTKFGQQQHMLSSALESNAKAPLCSRKQEPEWHGMPANPIPMGRGWLPTQESTDVQNVLVRVEQVSKQTVLEMAAFGECCHENVGNMFKVGRRSERDDSLW